MKARLQCDCGYNQVCDVGSDAKIGMFITESCHGCGKFSFMEIKDLKED